MPSRRTVLGVVGTSLLAGCTSLASGDDTTYTINAAQAVLVDSSNLVCLVACSRSRQTSDRITIEFEATVDGIPQVARNEQVVSDDVVNLDYAVNLDLKYEARAEEVKEARVRIDGLSNTTDWATATMTPPN